MIYLTLLFSLAVADTGTITAPGNIEYSRAILLNRLVSAYEEATRDLEVATEDLTVAYEAEEKYLSSLPLGNEYPDIKTEAVDGRHAFLRGVWSEDGSAFHPMTMPDGSDVVLSQSELRMMSRLFIAVSLAEDSYEEALGMEQVAKARVNRANE